jgi:hypothetical protein
MSRHGTCPPATRESRMSGGRERSRQRRRLLVAVLGIAIVLILTGSGLALAFTDTAGNPYETAINELAARGIVIGSGDKFLPDNPVKRMQFAKMIVKTMDYEVPAGTSCPFADVDPTPNAVDPLYPAKYVAVCAQKGVTTGYPDGTFKPGDSITRQQLITMVARAASLPEAPASFVPTFSDSQFGAAAHFASAKKAASAGLLEGLKDVGSSFDFLAPATRGECAQLLFNLSEYLTPEGPLPLFADLQATDPVGYEFDFGMSRFWREVWESDGWYESNQGNPFTAAHATGHVTLQIVAATGDTVTWRLVFDALNFSSNPGDMWEAMVAALPLTLEVKVDQQGQVLAISSSTKEETLEPLDPDMVARFSPSLAPIVNALMTPYSGNLVEPGDSVDKTEPYPSATKKWMDVATSVTFDSLAGDVAQLSYDFATSNMDVPIRIDLLPFLVKLGATPAPGSTEAVLDMNIKGQSTIVSTGQISVDTATGLPTAVTSSSTVNLDMWLNTPPAPELVQTLFTDSQLVNRVFVHDMTLTLSLTKDTAP